VETVTILADILPLWFDQLFGQMNGMYAGEMFNVANTLRASGIDPTWFSELMGDELFPPEVFSTPPAGA
jgi:hypothetical protein